MARTTAKCALGIDIGGTGVKGAPVDLRTGTLTQERFRLLTPQPATPDAIAETVFEVIRHFGWSERDGAIGIGLPSVVKHGVAHTAGNIDPAWIGCDAATLFKNTTGYTVTLLNDADAAGLAEMRFGAGRDLAGLVAIVTLGTGIGTALFHNGQLIPNTELGHLIIRDKDAERRASLSARERQNWSWKKWAGYVSEYLTELHRLLWCDAFILGGGASNKFDKFAAYLTCPTPVLPARMANLAGIIGAALATVPATQARAKSPS
ncbi:polyphosphate--glucose phosphotransferase [Chloracidobacterium thermophilum]|uniref:polyphosphate--glucose phosphotransferase n=1 Tax=Chloracidobacterium thermophilum TaxID=458033 RepID=UPI0002EA9459|nr:ROK family protein [Chloracidobacterium thermophilum]QUV77742.1 ROK family protein [Chloracidobacterium thermophilum]